MIGRHDLNLSEEDFWTMTPRLFDLLSRRHFDKERAEIERSDYRAARICAVLANIHRDKKKKPKPFKVEDFMPRYGPKKKQTVQEQFAMVKMLNAAFGGEVVYK